METITQEDAKLMELFGEIYYVTIRTEDKNHYAKRNALALKSEYFCKRFTCNGFNDSNKDIIDLPSITSENLEHIIKFTDTGKVSLTEDNALSLLLDADYLTIDELKKECYQFMCKNVAIKNAFQTYEIASLLYYDDLKEKAKNIIYPAFLLVSERDKYFLNCDVELLMEILSAPKVQACPPSAIFNAVMRWFTWNVEERKGHLLNILKKIRLAHVDLDYLENCFENLEDEVDVKEIISMRSTNVWRNSLYKKKRIAVLQASSLDIIEIYSSLTGKWELIETGDKECRSAYTCAAHDGKLYVFGGKIDGKCTNTAKVFDFSMKCWSSIAPMPTVRQRAASAVLGKYIYVLAGRIDDRTDVNWAERYCPTTNKWESIASLNEHRCDHSAVIWKGHLYVTGGVHWTGLTDRMCNWSSLIEKYDPRTNTWTNEEVLNRRRRRNFGITVFNDRIYSCGGIDHNDLLNCADYYNPSNEEHCSKYTHTLKSSMIQRRAHHMLAACEGKLWAIGGSDNTVEICDPETNLWIYGPPMNKINGAVVGAVLPC